MYCLKPQVEFKTKGDWLCHVPIILPKLLLLAAKRFINSKYVKRLNRSTKASFLSVDIETGDYEVDTDDLSPSMRLLAKRPEAVIYSLRIGYRAAHRIGFKFSVQK